MYIHSDCSHTNFVRKPNFIDDTASSPFKQLSCTALRPLDNLTHPLTKEEEEFHTPLTKMKVSRTADKATLRWKTRGQPAVYKRIVVPGKSSLLAISLLGKKRAKLTAKIRQDVSGSSADDSIKQQSSELNHHHHHHHYHHHHHHHHHHQNHHLSLSCQGRWGTTDDFTTSFLHFPLFSTAPWDLANSRPVHSLMLSSHLFFCMPCLLLPFTVPNLMNMFIPLQSASL